MRHAKSSWKTNASHDKVRPLNKRGRRAASQVAARLVQLRYEPQVVLSSDAVRTVQTWALMRDTFNFAPEVRVHKSLYRGGIGSLRKKLRRLPDSARTILAIGHHSAWEAAGEWLCGARVTLKTADVLILRGRGESWSDALELEESWDAVGHIRARRLESGAANLAQAFPGRLRTS